MLRDWDLAHDRSRCGDARLLHNLGLWTTCILPAPLPTHSFDSHG